MIGKDKTRILVTMTESMKEELELLATKELRNVSNFIVYVLQEYIKNNPSK